MPTLALAIVMNVNRRHLDESQRAMVAARIYPEPPKGGRGKKSSEMEGFLVSGAHVSRARTVLRFALDLADNVLSGGAAGVNEIAQPGTMGRAGGASDGPMKSTNWTLHRLKN